MITLFDEKKFWEFRKARSELRFWQALCAFTGAKRIDFVNNVGSQDTYFWGDKENVDGD